MTVATTAAKAGPYTGNNVASSFAFAFKVFADADVRVVETLIATDVETDLVLNTNYTVTRNADQDNNPGGSITYKVAGVTTALPSTKMLTIVGDMEYEQPTDIPNGGAWFASVIENALDRLTLLTKQLKEATDRSVKVPVSSSTNPDDLVASVTASEAAAAASAASAASSAAAAAAAIPSGSLGYTPVNITGDTMTGPLLLPAIKLNGGASVTSFGNVVGKDTGSAAGNVPVLGTKSATKVLPGLNYDIPQIQPVTASVATNALTLGLNPTTLDFRSETLTSGAVNTRQVGAAISLVVPDTATLGTVNATAARLMLLAIDATALGGAVELAVVNLAGGNNLDETTLISTTAISATADSASAIYSTTARTNAPFRVVGFIDITEATAGTWATAPSLVQGAGGNSMSSLGTGQTWQDVTGSRALSTTYYNTTGDLIFVNATQTYGSVGGPTMTINGVGVSGALTSTTATQSGYLWPIPVGASYSLAGGTLIAWKELR